MRKLVRWMVAVVLGLTAVVAIQAPAHAASIVYVRMSQWPTGYVGQVTVTNNFAIPVTGWDVAFDLPTGTTLSTSWSAQLATTTPHYIFVNATWNGSLAPGASTTFGFVATGTSDPVFLWP